VSKGESVSISFSFTVSGTPADKGWISAGFGVSETTTVSTSYECSGEDNQVVCLWAAQPYIEYEVRRKRQSTGPCEGQTDEWDGDSWRLNSPLLSGDFTYCVRDYCESDTGAEYWEDLNKFPNCAHDSKLPEPDWGF